ncbi:MAG: hypothetical protein Q8M09_06345 [Pseudomonadota bacterium]|nr:hypothetical protein [Pseudomonadota bacterium]MDP1903848.1 hypothetical protein [Pseudomonadota bacterium]MDP2353654.1 hypothetical protein [Pseudomonadota bacterium]
MKTSTLALVAFLSLAAAGTAQADGRPCLFDQATPSARQTAPVDMSKIEAAVRGGQISPYEAGRLMRQQWELAQFQRGFLEGAPAARSNLANRDGGGCGLGAANGDLGDMAGNVAGSMAKNGIQTATKVMRALMRETERLIQEKALDENAAF